MRLFALVLLLVCLSFTSGSASSFNLPRAISLPSENFSEVMLSIIRGTSHFQGVFSEESLARYTNFILTASQLNFHSFLFDDLIAVDDEVIVIYPTILPHGILVHWFEAEEARLASYISDREMEIEPYVVLA